MKLIRKFKCDLTGDNCVIIEIKGEEICLLEEQYGKFNFTFKTEKDLMKKEFNHMEFDYDCIRVNVEYRDGNKVDFPVKTEEEYHDFLLNSKWQERIKKFNTYKTEHFYDGFKYLEY
tara:strand:+ start:130 stop:480 length:351 start_codon:yes stop_codon:yes gene_type:complete